MATLHGILAELGIENPAMHPEREMEHETSHASADEGDWITDEKFMPVFGKSYQLIFAKLNFDGQQRHVLKRIRADGPTPDQWFDLNAGEPLEKDLREGVVK